MESSGMHALLNAHDLQTMGFSRPMVYNLLNRTDLPVIKIGKRRFMHKALFEAWLSEQATKNTADDNIA